MIELNKSQILEIVMDQLTTQHNQTPSSIKVNIDWLKFRYDKYNSEWHFIVKDIDEGILKYTVRDYYGYPSARYVTYQKLGDCIARIFPEMVRVEFDFKVKDDITLKTTMSNAEVMDLIDIVARVYHDDKTEIKQEELRDLIDLSLVIGDKVWFEELTNTYNSYSK